MPRRAAVRYCPLVTLSILVIGCRGERQTTSRTESTATSAAPSADVAAASGRGPWRLVAWEPHAGTEPGDYGIGVVFLRAAEFKGPRTGVDTLLLRAAPEEGADPVGAMLLTSMANGSWSYQVAATDSLRPNLLEYGYEESGVPFDSVDASGRWARGILGFTTGGSARTGWIDTRNETVGTLRWAEQLADRPIFFPRPERATFFTAPDSTRRASAPPPEPEYAIHPVEVRGEWLRVRVVQPSDNCVEPDSVRRQTRTLWIRYLDERGRPNVWYYTRGC